MAKQAGLANSSKMENDITRNKVPSKVKDYIVPGSQTPVFGQGYYSVKDEKTAAIKQFQGGIPSNVTASKPKTKSFGGSKDLSTLNQAIERFSTIGVDLAKAMNAFPHEIKLAATHNVNVTLNGAEVLKTMNEKLADLAVATTIEKINELITTRMPGIPPMQNTKPGSNQKEEKK